MFDDKNEGWMMLCSLSSSKRLPHSRSLTDEVEVKGGALLLGFL